MQLLVSLLIGVQVQQRQSPWALTPMHSSALFTFWGASNPTGGLIIEGGA